MYHDLYLKVDVLVLGCGLQTFREESINYFELDSDHYLSTPGYTWDVMKRFTCQILNIEYWISVKC